MSNDRDKLVAILNELERDYRAGNISKEKYDHLRERYVHKIRTIDASNRIRSMQGRENYSSNPRGGRNPRLNQNRYENNPRGGRNPRKPTAPRGYDNKNGEFQRFQEEPIGRSQRPIRDNHRTYNKDAQDKSSKGGAIAIGAIITIVLLIAFGSGIAMGIFNMGIEGDGNGISELINGGASINDTAFPIVKQDVKPTYNYTHYESNVSSSSSDYSGGDSDSGGSDSGGSDSGGSDSGGGGSGSGGSGSGGSYEE